MPELPQRLSLVRQTADHLRVEIARCAWRDWLPPERELASLLVVGRNTLRAALRRLSSEGLVEACHGSGHRILRPGPPPSAPDLPRSIGLLVPGGLQSPRTRQLLWIDELRALLARRGFDLQLHHSRRFPRDTRRHACWVLLLCDATLQRRFARAGVPCVIAGTPHAGVRLPFVDLDHRATCRHAAGTLLAQGHRRIALLAPRTPYAGDRESELGFLEGARLTRRAGVSAQVVRHDNTRAGVIRALRRLLRPPHAPTALLVADSLHCLTACSLATPAGVAVVCRDDDPFLARLVPAPARYASSPAAFARRLLRLVLRDGVAGPAVSSRILPRLVAGETLALQVPG